MGAARAARPGILSALASALLAACSTGPETPPPPTSVTIPIGGDAAASNSPQDAIYTAVLTQCRDAFRGRDAERLEGLISSYDRADAPGWARDQLTAFRTALAGLKFSLQGLAECRLSVDAPRLAAGEPIQVTLTLRSAWQEPIRIVAEEGDRRSSLVLTVAVRDEDAQGNGASEEVPRVELLQHDLVLPPGGVVTLPVTFPTTSGALLRSYEFSGVLMPVRLLAGADTLNVSRIPVAGTRAEVLPKGFESIARAPLTTLREAVRRGDPEHFGHQFLAAVLLEPRDKRQAGDLLAGVLRDGNSNQALVARACLIKLFGRPTRPGPVGAVVPVVERDEWLAWWQENRASW